MERWMIYAILSAIFAGCTSVVAKRGLENISGESLQVVRWFSSESLCWQENKNRLFQ